VQGAGDRGNINWNYIALIFSSTCVYAAGALFLAVKMFQRESCCFVVTALVARIDRRERSRVIRLALQRCAKCA